MSKDKMLSMNDAFKKLEESKFFVKLKGEELQTLQEQIPHIKYDKYQFKKGDKVRHRASGEIGIVVEAGSECIEDVTQ